MDKPIETTVSDTGVLSIRLNAPKARNVLDEAMLAALFSALEESRNNSDIRVVVFYGCSWVFSTGADLKMMRDVDAQHAKNDVGALLANVFYSLWSYPKPTLAVIEGPAMGGGAGLVAACDIAIASTKASFGFPEARIGLIPAVISPYVINAIGKRKANQLFLCGTPCSAQEALRIGLVHSVVEADKIDEASQAMLNDLLACGPDAQASVKQLVRTVADEAISIDQSKRLSKEIDSIRTHAEAREGIDAFLNKQKPNWAP